MGVSAANQAIASWDFTSLTNGVAGRCTGSVSDSPQARLRRLMACLEMAERRGAGSVAGGCCCAARVVSAAPISASHSRSRNFDLRSPLHRLTGADLNQVDGISTQAAMQNHRLDRHRHEPLEERKALYSWMALVLINKVAGALARFSQRHQPTRPQSFCAAAR